MDAKMRLRLEIDKDGHVTSAVFIYGPDAEKVAVGRGYKRGHGRAQWIRPGGAIDLDPGWEKGFPDRKEAEQEVCELAQLGAQPDGTLATRAAEASGKGR